MINDIRIHLSIIMYMFGCFSIMAFNAVMIYRKKVDNKAMQKNTDKWIKTIHQQLNSNIVSRRVTKKLKHVEKLMAFYTALNHFKHRCSDSYDKYMTMLTESAVFQPIALAYKKKKSAERAYFAYFVNQYPSVAKNTDGICKNITDTMVSFITASNIYCGVNVLKALCRVGDMHGVINTLQFFSDKSVYVHHKLLAEDLHSFSGNKEELAAKLWENHSMWSDNIVLGVISFITMFSDGFKSDFLPVLERQSTNATICLAIIRYYKKYSFAPAQPILIKHLNQTDNYDIAIEAASALSTYPGFITTRALGGALQSENWHVRYNAASSLVELGVFTDNTSDRIPSGNNDVQQMVQYRLAHANGENYMNVSDITA